MKKSRPIAVGILATLCTVSLGVSADAGPASGGDPAPRAPDTPTVLKLPEPTGADDSAYVAAAEETTSIALRDVKVFPSF